MNIARVNSAVCAAAAALWVVMFLSACGPAMPYESVHRVTQACLDVGGLPSYRTNDTGVYQVVCTSRTQGMKQ